MNNKEEMDILISNASAFFEMNENEMKSLSIKLKEWVFDNYKIIEPEMYEVIFEIYLFIINWTENVSAFRSFHSKDELLKNIDRYNELMKK